jgi:hypothetical protein
LARHHRQFPLFLDCGWMVDSCHDAVSRPTRGHRRPRQTRPWPRHRAGSGADSRRLCMALSWGGR